MLAAVIACLVLRGIGKNRIMRDKQLTRKLNLYYSQYFDLQGLTTRKLFGLKLLEN